MEFDILQNERIMDLLYCVDFSPLLIKMSDPWEAWLEV